MNGPYVNLFGGYSTSYFSYGIGTSSTNNSNTSPMSGTGTAGGLIPIGLNDEDVDGNGSQDILDDLTEWLENNQFTGGNATSSGYEATADYAADENQATATLYAWWEQLDDQADGENDFSDL